MAGYRWHVVARYTPANGPIQTFDFSDGFLNAGFRESVLVEVPLGYEAEMDREVDVNRSVQTRRFGWRPRFDLLFAIRTMAYQGRVFELANRLMDERWTVGISLDGAATYRRAVLAGDLSVDPLGRKTIAGVRHRVAVECVELVTSLRPFGTGTAW